MIPTIHRYISPRSQFHAIHRVALLLVLLLLLPSCRTTTVVDTQHRTVTDTLHLTLSDTTHLVLTHDTTIVTHREYITEHIIQRYDRETGNLTEQEITRSINRRADSIVAHRLDSLMHVNHLVADRSFSDTTSVTHQKEVHPAIASSTRPLWQRIVFSSFGLLVLILILSWLCLKAWLRRD